MAVPVQIWSPFLWVSPVDEAFSRDILRAQQEWQGEMYVWLMPDAKKIHRWSKKKGPLYHWECIIPSETFNLIKILHIDEGFRVFPSVRSECFPENILPQGLYAKWLNTKPSITPDPEIITMKVPVVTGDKITYIDQEFQTYPGPVFPIDFKGDSEPGFSLVWPPSDQGFTSISPEIESQAFFGPLSAQSDSKENDGPSIIIPEKDPEMSAVRLSIAWSKPFSMMFPTGSGMDLIYHQALIRQIIREYSDGNGEAMLHEIAVWVNRLTGEGISTVDAAWFMPKAVSNPNQALWDTEGRFDIPAEDLRELFASEKFVEIRESSAHVKRVNGWLGYFWWELSQDLEAGLAVGSCRRCGGIIRGGHKDRMYCTRAENPDCFRAQNKELQRKRRRRRNSIK